jgi:murein DD-endopeptidase MepM/ murein hydrolase activator NlpD
MNEEKRSSDTRGGTPEMRGSVGFSPVGATDRPRRRPALRTSVAFLALLLAFTSLGISLLFSGVEGPERGFLGFFRETTPHEAYLMGLAETGLATSALGQEWMAAAEGAKIRPLPLDLPYQEEGFFPQEEPTALGYRFSLRRGQRLTVQVDLASEAETRVFLDLFRLAPDTLRPPVHLYSPDSGTQLTFEPRRTGEYLLRIQPELLRGGRFRVMIRNDAALAFPVSGRGHRDIGSFFGDARDGGRRDHHGVDIFAPRGTPVVATSEGSVSRVDTTNIGGRVIWLRDRRLGASVYYAHLNEIRTTSGARVMPGED